ncbi:hypothetical protein HNR23_001974 [Nocardiopsis mwathae]|uniref:Uncharacterized protein n=1 Tax=Nocardiopsis mwathae TaxID=1472723 RepID=A0A7W9YH02_9ACTN|nr:hypothetical protein [Nocardiopsis mwathae]MBB6171914.1 hypothetical protein [Nocardiopsis mwathae]
MRRETRDRRGHGPVRPTAAPEPDGGGYARYAAHAAVLWSGLYAVLAAYWALTGHGFPYGAAPDAAVTEPLAGRFGPGVAWGAVLLAGVPAALLGAAMLRGVRAGRPVLIAVGALLSVQLLALMTSVDLLTLLGYVPYALVSVFTDPESAAAFAAKATEAGVLHQLLCLVGGFLWALATVAYARRTGDACLRCGRAQGGEGWRSPRNAARWGRAAVYLAVVTPVLYAFTRFAWAFGVPLGISEEFLREGQETGMWTSGAFLAAFGLVGAVLTLGLTQRWGEVFPRWMVGPAGRRVPVSLAVVPATLVAVLLVVAGIAMWSGYAEMVAETVSGDEMGALLLGVLPTALFPLWGAALGAATLAYYYRRRGACAVCGRGADEPAVAAR